MKGAALGRDCNICDHAFIEKGAVVGDHGAVERQGAGGSRGGVGEVERRADR